MPHRHGRLDQSPEELARQIARRLAETAPPTPSRFLWRDSVLVGRLISGSVRALVAVAVVGAVLVGVTWLMNETGEVEPEVLSAGVEIESPSTLGNDPEPSHGDEVPVVLSDSTTTTSFFLVPGTVPDDNGANTAITLPPPTTTSTSAGEPNSPSPTVVTSTAVPGPTTLPAPSTTSSAPQATTTTAPTTTIPPTTTVPTTPTTLPPTTTTIPQTTTTAASTTTTCGNRGSGNGNC